LEKLSKLVYFNLSRNPIQTLKGIEFLNYLQEFYLNNTNITIIVNEFDKLPNLKFISISGRLGYIPFDELRYLIEEKKIDFLPYGVPPYEPNN
jgi:hypothetical protein